MPPRNRPKSNSRSRLIGNGGRHRGAALGSAPERNAPAPPRASSPALRRLFAAGTHAATQVVGDVDELAAPPGRLSLADGVGSAQASGQAGTDTAPTNVEPDVLTAAGAGARVGRVDVLVTAGRATSFTLSPGGHVAAG